MAGWTREQIEEILRTRRSFRGMKLPAADFSGLDLEKVDFRSTSCPYAIFDDTNCQMINAEGANFAFTRWNRSNLHRANLKDAILSDADMSGVKDFFGVTLTMDCRTWKGLKLNPGHWYGFLFYGLLMEPPTEEAKESLILMLGEERYTTLKNLYSSRRM